MHCPNRAGAEYQPARGAGIVQALLYLGAFMVGFALGAVIMFFALSETAFRVARREAREASAKPPNGYEPEL